ncbi:MAG: CoA pyrophosphatase [Dehalococcoidia bacterium]|nr:MAG: CoA pyrophosphatase [Dehalococcoidia bacterium]
MRDRVREIIRAYTAQPMALDGRRDAAVLVLLHAVGGEEHVLLQVRTSTVEHHRGEISFPGGRRDPRDVTLLDTALRETHEEIGVPPSMVEVFGALDDTDTRASNYRVRPYVGAVAKGFDAFHHAEREVSDLLRVPLTHLLDPANHVWKAVEQEGVVTASPAYQFGEHVIWGATARVLVQFLGLIEGVPAEGTRL